MTHRERDVSRALVSPPAGRPPHLPRGSLGLRRQAVARPRWRLLPKVLVAQASSPCACVSARHSKSTACHFPSVEIASSWRPQLYPLMEQHTARGGACCATSSFTQTSG